MKKVNNGFTLIELLVVIAIIGLLSTFALISLDNSREKARDAKRIADVEQIQKALDLYYDAHGEYPISGNCNATIPNTYWCNSIESLSNGHWIRNGTTINLGEFLNKDPLDPLEKTSPSFVPYNGGGYYYFSWGYGGSGQWYQIVFGLEDYSNPLPQKDGVINCLGNFSHYGNNNDGLVTIGRDCQK